MDGTRKDWGHFRFSVIGGLLARPPQAGQLGEALQAVAAQQYRHPCNGTWVRFGVSTIERWYYTARDADDPVAALRRQVRSDAGANRVMPPPLLAALADQYQAYPHWSCRLHVDNLKALVSHQPELGPVPSYSTIRRHMKQRGWNKKRLARTHGQRQAAARLEQREVRSYESTHVHALWHLDFHVGSRRVVNDQGTWHSPKALCILDDCSRLCCHIQWYLDETAATLIHGLSQALHKRGLPRSLMTDNGAAMIAGETTGGLARLGIEHNLTLPYSPYQNGKQEAFWGQLEGRLLAMLSGKENLDLTLLNRTTQAWVEMEYNRGHHREINSSPLAKMLSHAGVARTSPDEEALRQAFTLRETRRQRKSDGTLQVKGVRFEVPARFRHMEQLHVRYQSWDLRRIYLVDPRTDLLLATIFPLDKISHGHGQRRRLMEEEPVPPTGTRLPPLLEMLLEKQAAAGLPPAYLIKGDKEDRS